MGLLSYLLFEWCNKCYPYRWRNRGLGRRDTLPNKFTQLDSGRIGNHAWGAFMRLGVVRPRVELDTRVFCRRFGRWSEASAIMFRGWAQGHTQHCWSAGWSWRCGTAVGSAASLVPSGSPPPSGSMSPELFVWVLRLKVSASSVAYLCCQVWRLWEANMASRPYLSPYFMSSLLLSVLTYSNFRATTRSRSLPENSSPAPTIMSGLICVIDSLFQIAYSGLLPASNLSCYIPSVSNFLVHGTH